MNLDEVIAKLADMPVKQRNEVVAMAVEATKDKPFIPSPGPQMAAYFSKADVLLFGGCVSGDTEYLTPSGWKRIDAYQVGDEVAQWSLDKALTFVRPEGYTDAPCGEMIRFQHSRLSMVVSPEHRMPLYDYQGVFVVKSAEAVAKAPSKHTVPVNFTVDRRGLPYTEEELRLAVAIHADGNLYVKKDGSASCRISLRKERKKERLLALLTRLGITWKEYHNPKRPTEVRYSFASPVATKSYEGFWWEASQQQLIIILEEMSYWDGDYSGIKGGDIIFNSARKPDIDFMQYAAHACGRVATYGAPTRGVYRLSVSHEGSVKSTVTLRGDAIKIDKVATSRKYCFTVPTSFWLARHQGLVFVTGNSPGGGKTALEVGLALNEHKRSLIVRRNFVDLAGVLHTLDNILGKENSAVGGNRPVYRKPEGGVIDFMGLGEDIGGKQGNPHSLICIDESAQVPENQVRLLMGWMRTDIPGERCRMVLGSNPPLDSTGDWMIGYFAPWLDPKHHNPAQEGELRYFLPAEDGRGDRECKPDDFIELHGVKVAPQSRTFISSKFTDNPYYDSEQYAKSLAGLPDEARDILMSGNFLTERTDDIFQAIPTSWIRAAQSRWTSVPPTGVPMCAIGVDIAQGGSDETVLAIRHDGWFAPMVAVPGKDTPDGKKAAGLVIAHRRNDAKVIVDIGGGWGGDCYAHLRENGVDAVSYMGVKPSLRRTVDRQLKFFNTRAEAYWRFREALDPSQPGGSSIALPHDSALVADLCAPVYEIGSNGIKLESKEKVCDRIGRSPDRGDAVVMAWFDGVKQVNIKDGWKGGRKTPKVVMSHAGARRG